MDSVSLERIACLHCDLPVTVGELRGGERASCPRCGHLLSSRTANGLERSLAFSLAAVVLLALASLDRLEIWREIERRMA